MTAINAKMREIKQNPLLSDEYIKSQKYMEASHPFDINRAIVGIAFFLVACCGIALYALAFGSVISAVVRLVLGD